MCSSFPKSYIRASFPDSDIETTTMSMAATAPEQLCANASCPVDRYCVEYEKTSVASGPRCCPRCTLRLEPRPEVADRCWFIGCEADPSCTRYRQATGEAQCCPVCDRWRKTRPRISNRTDACHNVRCPVGRSCRSRDVGYVHQKPMCECKDRCTSSRRKPVKQALRLSS